VLTSRKLASYYEVPKLKDKETTGADELEFLYEKTQDEVFGKTLELRRMDTILNNYIVNWEPQKDGRVRTQWGFKAASGQIDSRRPNVLNISKHSALGQRFRRIIVAPSGYCLMEFDKKSFHVATLGYLANDRDYLRFASLDPHSIFTSYIMPPSWGGAISFNLPDSEILGRCKEVKEHSKRDKVHTGIDLRQDTAKPCVLGNQLGLGPRKLWYKNRRAIRDEGQARELQQVLAGMFPKVESWKEWIIDLAARQTYLVDEWGKVQFFYEVYSWSKNKFTNRWERRRTDEAEKVLAFRVQGIAFGMLKYEHRLIEEKGWNEEYNWINTVHDSQVDLPLITKRDRCYENMTSIMNSPCPRLVNEATGPNGLQVRVEASYGSNLADFDKERNPEGMREIK